MGMGYPAQSAIAAVLESIGQNKKKKAMEDTLERARQKGYDIDIELDPATGQAKYNLKYKGKSQSDITKDQFEVAKMLAEMQKWKRGEQGAQQEEQFNWLANLGFGGGAQRLQREGISGQYKPDIKQALEMRNKFRGTGQTLLPTEKGWTKAALPKTVKEKAPTMTEQFRTDFRDLINFLRELDTLPINRQEKNIRKNKAKAMFLDEYPDKALIVNDYFQNIKGLK